MKTDVLEIDPISQELERQNVTEAVIAGLRTKFMSLTINGIDDKKGYEAVRAGRIECKNTRVLAKKICEKGREEALEIQRAWISKEKEVVGKIAEIESYLAEQEDAIDTEKQRIKDEAIRKEQQRIQARIDGLAAYGFQVNYDTIKNATDAEFDEMLADAKSQYEAELAEKAEAERLQREEAERLVKERQELEEMRRQQAEAQAKIDAERKAVEDAKLAHEARLRREEDEKNRAIEMEKARKEAAKKAEADLIQKQKDEAERKAEADRKAKAKAARAEALKPIKIRLTDFANQFSNMELPVFNDADADTIVAEVKSLLLKVQNHIITRSENL